MFENAPFGEVISSSAHRFAFANLELSHQRDVRASLGLGTYVRRDALFRVKSHPVDTAMRAADECHPLPDQLHPCSLFSRFSWKKSCDLF
jgi:hypothetical protein